MTGRRLPEEREIAGMLSLFFVVEHVKVWDFFYENFRNVLSVEILDGRINFVDNEYIVLSMGYLADEAVRWNTV